MILRISAQAYNDQAQYERLAEAIQRAESGGRRAEAIRPG
jgi:hypothetical protein